MCTALKGIRILIVLCMIAAVVSFSTSCFFDDDSDSEEIRIYLAESTVADDITGLYVVQSPQGASGNWGNNIINNYQVLQDYGWKMYTFSPGTYDIKIEHNGSHTANPYYEYSVKGLNKQGIKYDLDSGYLFRTTFTFN